MDWIWGRVNLVASIYINEFHGNWSGSFWFRIHCWCMISSRLTIPISLRRRWKSMELYAPPCIFITDLNSRTMLTLSGIGRNYSSSKITHSYYISLFALLQPWPHKYTIFSIQSNTNPLLRISISRTRMSHKLWLTWFLQIAKYLSLSFIYALQAALNVMEACRRVQRNKAITNFVVECLSSFIYV